MPQAKTMMEPRRLPLVQSLDVRGNTPFVNGLPTDAMLINCSAEKQPDGSWQVEKRPGLSAPVYTLVPGGADSFGGGMWLYNPASGAYQLTICGGKFYINGAGSFAIGTGTLGKGLPYWFDQGYNGSTLVATMGSGLLGYYWSPPPSGGPVQITDANFPASFTGQIRYLDGTFYVMDHAGNIYNSALNNPANWTPLSTIAAIGNADSGVYLAKQLVYIVALKSTSYAVFYDAANATGSPLSLLSGAGRSIGCVDNRTVQCITDDLYWLATDLAGSMWIVRLRNLEPMKVSTPAVDRILNNWTLVVGAWYSWQLRDAGHLYYGLTHTGLNITLVYDIGENIWEIWTDTNGNFWPITNYSIDINSNRLVQHASNGNVYKTDNDFVYPTDNGALIPVHIVTPNFDGGIDRVKTLNILRALTDQTPGNVMQSRYSDDDYQSWSVFEQMDLSVARPFLDDQGSFYRRAYDFYHNLAKPFRIKAVDLQFDIGIS